MKHPLALALAAAAALTFTVTSAQAQQPLAFVDCPIMRDTATVPCWLAQYKGELYYLMSQDDPSATTYAPSLGHQALIEGTPTEARRCGAKVMENVHISVRPDRDRSCDAIIPAADAFRIEGRPQGAGFTTLGPAPRPPQPERPAGSLSRKFEVLYDFDRQTAGRDTEIIQEAAAYALANPMAELHVVGFRASVQLASGQVLAEEESIALRRAVELVETLTALGVDRQMFTVENKEPELGDYTRRRAIIEVTMSGSDDHSEH